MVVPEGWEDGKEDKSCLPADELTAGPIRELLTTPNLYNVRVPAVVRGMGGLWMYNIAREFFNFFNRR